MISPRGSDVLISVRVQPKASREGIETDDSGRVRVRVTAPPEDNAANEAVIRLVARVLGVSASRVAIEQGRRGREKVLLVQGISAEQVRERLGSSVD